MSPIFAGSTGDPLVAASAAPALLRRLGITTTARALALAGFLLGVTVGRAVYYRLSEMLAAAPGPVYPLITPERADLTNAGHTITVERVDWDTARGWMPYHQPEDLIGGLAVVERTGGRLGKICAFEADGATCSMEELAESYADTYGARYVPAGGAR